MYMLTAPERALVFRACWHHPIAKCGRCGASFRSTELAADPFCGLSNLCPSCRIDLTDSIREHLISCPVASVLSARDTVADGTLIREDSVTLREDAHRLRDAAGVARAEVEAAIERKKRAETEAPPGAYLAWSRYKNLNDSPAQDS